MELAARAESLVAADGLPTSAAQQLALETMQLYAPMAHALHATGLARRLEDEAFQLLLPSSYAAVTQALEQQLPAGAF